MLEECLRAGVERVVYTSSVAAIGPAPRAARPPTSASPSTRRASGIPYVDTKHEAEIEALRIARAGCRS